MDGEKKTMPLTFMTTPNSQWDTRIDGGVHQELDARTDSPQIFESHHLYAFEGDIFAGGVLFQQQGESLWIDSFWVEKPFRNRGIGTALLHHVTLFAGRLHCKNIQLNTYFLEAKSFFLHSGFEEVARIPQWKFGLECCFMRKRL